MATEDALRELAANAAASNFSLTVVRSQQSLVPVWELVDFVGRQFAPTRLLFSQNQEVPNAYTTDQVHQHQSHRRGVRAVRGLAGDQTIREWARDALLKAAKPSFAEQTIVAELLALRMILMNILFTIANRVPLTSTAMDDIIKRADAVKLAKAMERLTRPTTEPQRG